MKKICKVILAAAAIVALAAPAMAADKLIVKNAAGTGDAFKVSDAGTVTVRNAGDTADVFTVNNTGVVSTTGKLGIGTTSPFVNVHLHVPGSAIAQGTSLYNASSPFTADNQNTSVLADFVVADSTGTAGNMGAIRGIRARGSLLVPTVPLTDDVVLSVLAGIWDGAAVRNTADVNFSVDGAVSSNIAPARIAFRTKTGGTGAFVERLKILNDGKILMDVVNMPVYSDNTAAASLTAGTLYRTSTGTLMIKY